VSKIVATAIARERDAKIALCSDFKKVIFSFDTYLHFKAKATINPKIATISKNLSNFVQRIKYPSIKIYF
jgi:hypothetical protein